MVYLDAPAVLVVDDDEMARFLLERALADHFKTVSVASAREALALAAETPFNAVLVDLHLPDKNGLWLLEQLAERAPTTRRVLISGDCDGARTGSSAVEAFLQKPVSIHEVQHCLRRLIDAAPP